MNNASNTAGILARILLNLVRDGSIALNRLPFSAAGKLEESAADLALLMRALVIEEVLDEDEISAQIPGVEYIGEGGPVLCSECFAICDFGSRGDGGATQDPHTGVIVCAEHA